MSSSPANINAASLPASSLAERWTTIDELDVFYRESLEPPDASVMMQLHGFGLSGRGARDQFSHPGELSLLVHPLLAGSGRRDWNGTEPPAHRLKLVTAETVGDGCLWTRYRLVD